MTEEEIKNLSDGVLIDIHGYNYTVLGSADEASKTRKELLRRLAREKPAPAPQPMFVKVTAVAETNTEGSPCLMPVSVGFMQVNKDYNLKYPHMNTLFLDEDETTVIQTFSQILAAIENHSGGLVIDAAGGA